MSKRRSFRTLAQKLRARLMQTSGAQSPVATTKKKKPSEIRSIQLEWLESRAMLAAVTWTGAGDGVNWSNLNNWSNVALPTSADDVTINSAASVQLTSSTTVRTLNVGSAATLNIANNNALAVIAGVTDNGLIKLGSADNTKWGGLQLQGTQTVTGTGSILFNASTNTSNAISVTTASANVTIDSGIVIHGSTGQFTTPGAGARLTNRGTISADVSGGTFTIAGTFTNTATGVIAVANSGNLSLTGAWDNAATISNQGGNITFSGTYTSGSLNGISHIGTASIFTLGSGSNLNITTTGASWRISGSLSGTITSTDPILAMAGQFTGVTIAANTTINAGGGSQVTVINGLTVNGTFSTGPGPSNLIFRGTQTLGGSGQIVSSPGIYSQLIQATFLSSPAIPTTLTIGPSLTLRGANLVLRNVSPAAGIINQGTILTDVISTAMSALGLVSGSTATFVNQGTIKASSGGRITLGFNVINNGIMESADSGSIIYNNSAALSNTGALRATNGGLITANYPISIDGSGTVYQDPTSTLSLFTTLSGTTTNLAGSDLRGITYVSQLEAMSEDRGATAAGFTNNFVFGNLSIYGTAQLRDLSDNSAGAPDAVYARTLTIPTGASLDLNGLHLYTLSANISGTVTNGSVTIVNINAPTTTSLAISPTSAVYGTPVTLTASVSSDTPGTIDGTVVFYNGNLAIGTATVDANGLASLTLSNLSGGTRSITAIYSGSSSYDPSLTPVTSLVISPYNTSLTLNLSAANIVTGQSPTVTATATIAPGGAAPTGTVSFYKNGVFINSASFDSNGVATATIFNSSTAEVGTFDITATYNASTNYSAATAPAVPLAITQAATNTTLTTSLPSTTVGQSVTLTATTTVVAPGSLTATGSITFYNNGVAIGSGTLNVAGVATLTLNSLPAGSNSLTAIYTGDANRTGSTSNAVTLPVAMATSTTTINAAPASTYYGENVTITATVPWTGVAPTGTITFKEYSQVIGVVTLDANGSAVLVTPGINVGTRYISAEYSGDANRTGSSNATVVTVAQATPIASLNLSSTSTTYGESITFTATFTAAVLPPTGNVTFWENGTILATVPLSNGVAVTTSSALTAGTHQVYVSFGGNTQFTYAATSLQYITVAKLNTSASLEVTTPITYGQSATLTATVSSSSITPNGNVTFYDNGLSLGTYSLNGSGVATRLIEAPSAGTHSYTAVYAGSTNFNAAPATAPAILTVDKAATTTALAITPASTTLGGTTHLVATLSLTGSTLAGSTITFKDGDTVLGTVAVDHPTGTAGLDIALTGVGEHAITAEFSGNASYQSSTSAPETLTVGPATPSYTFSANTSTIALGEQANFTFHVDALSAIMPTGTITLHAGAIELGVATLDAFGNAVISTDGVAAGITPGDYEITAIYSGDGNFNSVTTSAVNLQVLKGVTSTSISASGTSTQWGQSTTFTATVTRNPNAPALSGSVTFFEGTTDLGTVALVSGSAALTLALPVGDHDVHAVFNATSLFATSASNATSITVLTADTSAALDVTENAVFGENVTLAVTIASPAGTPTGSVSFFDGLISLGSATLDNGIATLSITALSVGTHSITAVYAGDANFSATTSTAKTATITAASSSVQLTSNLESATFGQSLTITAAVSAAASSGNVTGQVEFFDGEVSLGVFALNAGVASFTSAALATGAHALSATYLGDTNHTGSSAAITQTVAPASTSILVTTSDVYVGSPTIVAASVTTLAPGNGVATGSVEFFDGQTSLGTAPLTAGAASLTVSLSLGAHSLTAVYLGDANHDGSTSSAVTQSVAQAVSNGSISSDFVTRDFGQSVTFTATFLLTAGDAPFTGAVEFFDDAVSLGNVTIGSDGIAQLATAALGAGSHQIHAVYEGTALIAGATTVNIGLAVNTLSTSTSLTYPVSTVYYGTNNTLTATVTAGGDPAGTVTLYNGATALATAPVVNGVATFSTVGFEVGSYSLVASYSGDANHLASNSLPQSFSVTKMAVTLTLTSASSTSTPYGEPVTYSVSIAESSAGTPTGTVNLSDNGTTIATATLDQNGTATFSPVVLGLGNHPISVYFPGDTHFVSNASNTIVQQVVQGSSSTSIALSTANSTHGSPVTLTATVTTPLPAGAGTVWFFDGENWLGQGTLNGSGSASLVVNSLGAGTHNLTAHFMGTSQFSPSVSAGETLTIDKATPSVSVATSASTSDYFQTVTFTATVAKAPAGTDITGLVTFYSDGIAIASGSVNPDGTAAFSTNNLTAGTHAITASYEGNADYNASASPAMTQTVNRINATTSLILGLTSSSYGQPFSISATVTGAGASPTGTVSFYDGGTLIDTAPISGLASIASSNLSVGSHAITAVYNGDANYNAGSPTAAQTHTVSKTNTSVALTANPSSAQIGTATTFTAVISRAETGGNQASGTVTFKDGGTTFATVAVDANGVATYTRSDLSIATHNITAVYNGDSSYNTSTSATATVTTTKAETTASLSLSATDINYMTSVTLTATITSAYAGPIGGTVTFKDGTTTLGTATLNANGQATFTKNNFTPGTHSLTVVYGGNTTYLSSTSAAAVLTVNKLPSISTLMLSKTTSNFGQNVTMTAQMTNGAGGWPTGNVTFYDAGVALGNANLNSSGKATLSKSNFTRGTHSIYYIYNGNTYYLTSTSNSLTLTVV